MDGMIVIVVIFFAFLMMSGGGTKKTTIYTEQDKRRENIGNKIIKTRRKLEGLEIKKQEYSNEIENLNYEVEDDLTKTGNNDLKIRKLNLKIETINDKILQAKGTLMDLEQQLNSIY